MQSPHHHRSPGRSAWAHANTPEALLRRRAKADARREAMAAELPPIAPDPEPLSVWQTVLVLGSGGKVMHRITLHAPVRGCRCRCDQHATEIDGARALMTATAIGQAVAGMIYKRPSTALLRESR